MRKVFLYLITILLLVSCKRDVSKDLTLNEKYKNTKLLINFHRLPESISFEVIIKAKNNDNIDVNINDVNIYSNRGKIGQLKKIAKNEFKATITTNGTGEYKIVSSLRHSNVKVSKTAVVLAYVDENWDQPEAVEGLVNTKGWEDGVAVSSNGQWLFIQYIPVPIDCMIAGDPDNELCTKVIGPVEAPYRPDMPGAERVLPDGTIKNECPSLNFYNPPFPVPPNSLYGFKRQKDGSFKEPFPIYFAGSDGCISAFGPALFSEAKNNFLLFAFDNPLVEESKSTHGDLYALKIKLGKKIILGNFVKNEGKISLKNFNAKRIGNPYEGHQGNPHHWKDNNGTIFVFYDDENNRKDLFSTYTDSGILSERWSQSVKIPSPVSSQTYLEAQPFFDGKFLYFRREIEILKSKWKGGSFSEKDSWERPMLVLKGDSFSAKEKHILGVGEPTIAKIGKKRELYFVYIIKTEEGTLDLNIGKVNSR